MPINDHNFLDSPEALQAKLEVETSQLETIGDLSDFDKWIQQVKKDED